MNLIQFKQVQGLDSKFAQNASSLDAVSGYLDGEIWYLMAGDNTFTGNKIFKDSVTFLEPVTGTSSGNFLGGLWVNTDKVITSADTGNLVDNSHDQTITGIKTFQGAATNTIHQGGTVYIRQWGSAGEPPVGLRITGELWITGADGSATQITADSPWSRSAEKIYYNVESGRVGIGVSDPVYSLHTAGIGAFGTLKSTGTNQNVFNYPIGIGTGASSFSDHFSTWSTGLGSVTGAEFVNDSSQVGSTSEIRMVADSNLGAGDYGAVNIGVQREDAMGTSSFIVKTKTGVSYTAGFDTRFRISGASIFVDHDSLPSSNPERRGELWLSESSSRPGSSYLMVSSGVAP